MTAFHKLILDPPDIVLEANGKQTQYVTVTLWDGSGKRIVDGTASTFVVTDTSVATVTTAGIVQAVAPGSTTLTVTSESGAIETAPITVFQVT